MLVVISPAKALNFDPAPDGLPSSQPALMAQTRELMKTTRTLTRSDIAGLMDLSDNLAELNFDRFKAFRLKHTAENAKQAALAFAGDTYRGLDAGTLDGDDLGYAQDHLRILSGLYGVLRPLDLIQPYRLEMGTRLATPRGENLHDFWGDRITRALNRDLGEHDNPVLVNAASVEYFSAVKTAKLKARPIDTVFKEERDGVARIISFSAKVARGMIARYTIQNRIDRPEGLKDFDLDGYRFRKDLSDENTYTFIRADMRGQDLAA
ncbi:MAG: peroxide stress protein YaaA [Rhodospirillales bacterium]|nr:peroxide stress protein YaaA [Rhodospirillales bacterium]